MIKYQTAKIIKYLIFMKVINSQIFLTAHLINKISLFIVLKKIKKNFVQLIKFLNKINYKKKWSIAQKIFLILTQDHRY